MVFFFSERVREVKGNHDIRLLGINVIETVRPDALALLGFDNTGRRH
jgi:hypothetical protein